MHRAFSPDNNPSGFSQWCWVHSWGIGTGKSISLSLPPSSGMWSSFYLSTTSQLVFRPRMELLSQGTTADWPDKNHTSLSSHSVNYGVVFTNNQICSEEYLAIGSMIGTSISHGFVSIYVYLGCIQEYSSFPKHYTKFPTNIAPCIIVLCHQMSVDSQQI